ncbi:MAG: hypothetical protein AAGK22_09920 [Acidobacteriota bacterium]
MARAARKKLPHVVALVALVPAALQGAQEGDWAMTALVGVVIVANLLALVAGEHMTRSVQALVNGANAALCLLVGWRLMEGGSDAVHWVWFFAAAVFAIVTVLFLRQPEGSSNE